MKVYYDGCIVDREEVSEVFEPGFLYGWGVFEAMRVYQGKIPLIEKRINRLIQSAQVIGLNPEEIDYKKAVLKMLSANNLNNAYVRITLYKRRKQTGTLIYVDSLGYYPASLCGKGFSALISSYKRDPESLNSKIKSLSRLENQLAWNEAKNKNKGEALLFNRHGFLAGGSRSNVFLVKDSAVITPSLGCGAFNGITRAVVIELCKNKGINFLEKKITKNEIFSAEEAFITSSLLEVMPLIECDGINISDGSEGGITRMISSAYIQYL